MAKKASPWYWEARNGWYVLLNGQRHFLGEHPRNAPNPKKGKRGWNSPPEIDAAYQRLLSSGSPQEEPTAGDTVVAVLDDFITWTKENRAGRTAERYEDFCQLFVQATVGGVKLGLLDPLRLTAKHVTQWLTTQEGWSGTTKRNAITALQRGFNWAVKNRGLEKNPIKGMEKPQAGRRSDVITPAEFDEIMSVIGEGCFWDLLTVSYDSGARPFEVKELQARHFQPDNRRAVIPAEEAKGKRRTRVIYFPTDRSMDIVNRLCAANPFGPIFLNAKGRPWTAMAVKCRFEDIQLAIGLKEMERRGIPLDTSEDSVAAVYKTLSKFRVQKGTGKKIVKQEGELRKEARRKLIVEQAQKYGKRFNHYAFRRTFITRKIIAGVDSHVVAKLAGHESTAMIDRHYSAIADDAEFMLKQATRDIASKPPTPTSNS